MFEAHVGRLRRDVTLVSVSAVLHERDLVTTLGSEPSPKTMTTVKLRVSLCPVQVNSALDFLQKPAVASVHLNLYREEGMGGEKERQKGQDVSPAELHNN